MKINKSTTAPGVKVAPSAYVSLDHIQDLADLGKMRSVDKEWAEELQASIMASGLDQPIICWNGGDEFPKMKISETELPASWLVAGAHRRSALRKFRKEDPTAFAKMFPNGIPVIIKSGTMQDMICLQLRENVERKDPTPAEILPRMERLRDEFKMKQKAISSAIGKSVSWVSQIFDMAENLGEEGNEALKSGEIGFRPGMKAKNEIKAALKKGEKPDVAAAVKKAKVATAAAKSGETKKPSLKKLYGMFKALPSIAMTRRAVVLEAIIQFTLGEIASLPPELKSIKLKPSKKD